MFVAPIIQYSNCRTCDSGSYYELRFFEDLEGVKNFIIENLSDTEIPEFYNVHTRKRYEVWYTLANHCTTGARILDDDRATITETHMSSTGKLVWI